MMETVSLYLLVFIMFMICVFLVIALAGVIRGIRADAERARRFEAARKEHDEMKRRIRKELGYDSK